MRNLWTKFIPLENLAQKYSILSCIYTPENLLVVLVDSSDSSTPLYITFGAKIFSYQKTSRSLFLQTTSTVTSKYYADAFFDTWALFEIKNSSYAEWVSKESLGIFAIEELLHFVCITTDYVFEFITAYPPIVSFEPPTKPSQ